jgi:Ca2+-binding EF-hand superfamily protein
VKESLENLNITLESIIYAELKHTSNQLVSVRYLQRVFEKMEVVITQKEGERILQDVRKANGGKFECSFNSFVNYMTRKRVNVAFQDKGFIDPLIAQCCQQFSRAKDHFGLTWERLFAIFDGHKKRQLTKEQFVLCAQGMQLAISPEDIVELFNFMDDKG